MQADAPEPASSSTPVLEATTHSAVRTTVDQAVASDLMKPISARPNIFRYTQNLFGRRHFIYQHARSKVRSGNFQTKLGPVWLVLSPVLDALFYWTIFGVLLGISRGLDNYVAFVIIGVLMFRFTKTSISQGVKCIQQSQRLIKAFPFPRASVPVSLVVKAGMEQILVIVVMLIMILAIPPHVVPSWHWVLGIAIFALQVFMNLGFAFIFARLGHTMPDLAQAMSFISRLLLYGSAVLFPVERFVSDPTLLAIVKLNPIWILLDMYRTIFIDNQAPDAQSWLMLTAWSLGLCILGYVFFWLKEEFYSRGV